MPDPPASAGVHPNPPIKLPQHVQGAEGAESTEGVEVIDMNYARVRGARNVNADGLIPRGRGRFANEEYETRVVRVEMACDRKVLKVAEVRLFARWYVCQKVGGGGISWQGSGCRVWQIVRPPCRHV